MRPTNTVGEFVGALGLSEEDADLLIKRNPPLTAEEVAQSKKDSQQAETVASGETS
jgi:hypothetical protein